MKNFTCQH